MGLRMRKERREIPEDVAAEVLFRADRTCCVCRARHKPVQLHHIDEDPANSVFENLATLCLECHNDTQLRGGFGRKLDAAQVKRYREDWHAKVAEARQVLDLPRTTDADLAVSALPQVLEHDRRVFQSANVLLSEEQLTQVLKQLYHDDSYERSAFQRLVTYMRHLQRAENQFILDALEARADSMLCALEALTDFIAHHFFSWPRRQAERYCLYPDLNVDRGGDGRPEDMLLYSQRQDELTVLIESVHQAWRDFRRAVHRGLFI